MDGKELAGDTYLKLRGRTYYFERRVPLQLVASFGKIHIRESLRTTEKREAKQLRDLKAAKYQEALRELERQNDAINRTPARRLDDMSDGQIELLGSEWARSEGKAIRDTLISSENEYTDEGDEVLSPDQVLAELHHELAIMEEGAQPQGRNRFPIWYSSPVGLLA